MKHIVGEPYNLFLDKTEFKPGYDRIIAIGECTDYSRDDLIGDQRFLTKSFPIDTPAADIMQWAWEKGITGKLILTVDEGSKIEGAGK
jgi:hypothetical protein